MQTPRAWLGWIDATGRLRAARGTPQSPVVIDDLPQTGLPRADIHGDEIIDSRGIRAFALEYDLMLLSQFARKLEILETMEVRSARGRPRCDPGTA